MPSIRLITDQVQIYFSNLDQSELVSEQNYILRAPTGNYLTLCFSSHLTSIKLIHPLVTQAIQNNIGVVYICEALPENPIIDNHIVYVVCPFQWYTHTLLMNALQFKAVFSSEKSSRLARSFSEFTSYQIPYIKTSLEFQNLINQVGEISNKILLEITGGVGDHLLTIPSIKTLASEGKKVYILCTSNRVDCFKNLDYISGIFTHRSQINVSQYSQIIILHFGQILNDYRSETNKQNRIFAVAQLCGLDKNKLVTKIPEIIFNGEELELARKKWGSYSNKLFFGFDSDRVDAKMPEFLAQEKINAFKAKGFTVFTTSLKAHNLKNCIDLSKQLSLRELFSLIAIMDYVVTLDTAFLHIAGALEKKTFALMNYFEPSWRCGTYRNCTSLIPHIKCFPCVAKQFVPSSQWQCKERSCFTYFDWEALYRELSRLKLHTKSPQKFLEPIKQVQVCDRHTKDNIDIKFKDISNFSILDTRNQFKEKIAAVWLGGMGDAVMAGYLARAIVDKHQDAQIDVYLRDTTQANLFMFDIPRIRPCISKVSWRALKVTLHSQYDIIYEFQHYPNVFYTKKKHLNKPLNLELYNNWLKSSREILKSWNGSIFEYFAKQTDLIVLDKHLKLPLASLDTDSINLKLVKYNLPKNYITLAPGCDKNLGIMKLWPTEKWQALIFKLKQVDKNIVILGDTSAQTIPGVTKIICDDLLDMALILKNSHLHISNEGGSIHLAHAVGTKSVVLFGPTNPTLYGYSDNINIYSNLCPSCWWTVPEWSKTCKLGHKSCINLDAILVDDVYAKIMQELG